jgi:uncharacterized protein YjbI with pentapeptide repeats
MARFDVKTLDRGIRTKARQRKDDNKEFYETHLQQLSGDSAIAEEIFDEGSPVDSEGFFAFDRQEYRFARFNGLTMGRNQTGDDKSQALVSSVTFYYCDFDFCGFSNLRFSHCAFVGCNFSECYTLEFASVFEHCRFMSRFEGESHVEDAPCMFTNCELSARFIDSDLSMAVVETCHFYFSTMEKTSVKDAIFLNCSFDTMKVGDCDLRNTKILKPKFIEFQIEDSLQRTKASKHTYLGPIDFNPKEEREVRFAADVYSQFNELFENNKLMDLSGEYFFLTKMTERINLRGLPKFKSFLGMMTCGYGERPSYSLLSALALVLVCGTLYMFFGVSINNEVLVFVPTAEQWFPPAHELILWYHFSLVTFSTVGYGNVVPVGGSLVVSAVEMVLGVIMVGIWVSTLVRKMVR